MPISRRMQLISNDEKAIAIECDILAIGDTLPCKIRAPSSFPFLSNAQELHFEDQKRDWILVPSAEVCTRGQALYLINCSFSFCHMLRPSTKLLSVSRLIRVSYP